MVKILCTADLHLGRRSSRVPGDGAEHSCARAWERVVDLALDLAVDLVALCGDLVDHDNRFFEAVGPLERGLGRLAKASIPAVAVAGNHDWDVLRDVAAARPDALRLLGQGGRWEHVRLELKGGPLDVTAWSFPAAIVSENPLSDLVLEPDPAIPHLGLVHSELDQAGGRYAPMTRDDLARFPVDMWLVGHIHKRPGVHDAGLGPVILVPGSPQAMDPGEPGPHGVWLVEMETGARPAPRRALTSTVRYDSLEMDVSDLDESGVRVAVTRALTDHLTGVGAASPGPLQLVSCRLRLSGRTGLHGPDLAGLLADLIHESDLGSGRLSLVVEQWEDATRPAVDLDALAQAKGPLGLLARTLLDLEQGSHTPELQRLAAQARHAMADIHAAPPYLPLGDPSPDEQAARHVLLEQGYRLLDGLLAQKEGA